MWEPPANQFDSRAFCRMSRRGLLKGAACVASFGGSRLIASPVKDMVVSKTGRPGSLPTLGAALAQVKQYTGPARILLEEGIYEEKLTVEVPDLAIVGQGQDTVISFGAAAGHLDPNGRKWGTGGSATLTVKASGVTLANLTIRNSFDYLKDAPSSGGAQAVALSIARGADRAVIRDCRIEGYQDTLYLQQDCRVLVERTTISGNVDFIFGGATALVRDCEIRSRHVPGAEMQGFVAAPSTPATTPVGMVFRNCRLTREEGLPDASVYLGRPWRAGGNMALTGAAAFIDSWMDGHIHPTGWTSMGFTDPLGMRRQLMPWQARLFETGSLGPGASAPSPTRRTLPQPLELQMQASRIFGDWNPM